MSVVDNNFQAVRQRLQQINQQLAQRDGDVAALKRQIQALTEAQAGLQGRLQQVMAMVASTGSSEPDEG